MHHPQRFYSAAQLQYHLHLAAKQNMPAPTALLEVTSCRRPTFFPAGKLRPLDKEVVLQDRRALTMHNFVTVLADLSYPKAALAQLQDAAYMLALEDGIRAALDEQPGDHAARSRS